MYQPIKRTIDFLAALTGLLLLSPIMIITTIILKCTGEGKIFFTQQRVGHKNKSFKIWKFISMVSNAQQAPDGTITGKHDMRITPVGHFLRNSKIDEFPQFFNILNGDMSLVGPRPLMQKPDFESYPPEVQQTIYNVRPGVTAIGSVVFRDEAALITQVQEEGGDAAAFKQKVIFPYKGKLEMWYNENQSFWVDLKILLLTAWTLIFPTSQLAYKSFKGLPERSEALKLEFDRLSELRESITLLLMVIFVLIPIVPSPFWFWNNPQFILMALVPVLSFAYLLFRDNSMSIDFIPSDIGWAVFILAGFASYFWAINGALIWYQAFGWLCLVLWMLLFRSLSLKKTAISILPLLFAFFFVAMLFHHVAALFWEVPIDRHWNDFFGKNANYTSCFLVSLYPYLLFYNTKKRLISVLKIIASIGLLYIITLTNARWAIIAFVLIVLYYLWNNFKKGYFIAALGSTFLALAWIYNIDATNANEQLIVNVPVLNEFIEIKESYKYHLIRSSLLVFLEHPLAGIGFGNWQLEVYKFSVDAINKFNDPAIFYRVRSHNLYSQLLVELGLLGFIAFLYPILGAMRSGWVYYKELTAFQQASYASFLVYLITAFFYNDVNFYEYHFSGMQLLAFCALGILTNSDKRKKALPTNTNYLFFVISLACLAWFGYTKYTYNQYVAAKEIRSQENPERAIHQLEHLYHPIFQTANGFKEKYSFNQLIALDLAELYQKQKNKEQSERYYQIALAQAPYNEYVLLSYAKFLLRVKKAPTKAKVHALQIYAIQPQHYENQLLLAEIAIIEKEYEQAEQYLSFVEGVIQYKSKVEALKILIPR